jgi:FkbM family methyltransferase
MTFYSQCRQDEILYSRYFEKLSKPGFFIEIGAHNGEYLSNTLFYEESLNWNGICIEASPLLFVECKKRRKCLSLNYAICNNDGEANFLELIGDPTPLSGLVDMYDPRHIQRIDNHIQTIGGEKNYINISTRKLQTVLDDNNINEVHYLSIDTEGAELDILKSIDFKKTFIHVVEIENNYPDTFNEIKNILLSNGFIHDKNIEWDEIFINSKSVLLY